MRLRATPAERRALLRLPLREDSIRKDVYRRALWWRLTQKGWAVWTLGRVLDRSGAGWVACARSRAEYEDRSSAEMEKFHTEQEQALR